MKKIELDYIMNDEETKAESKFSKFWSWVGCFIFGAGFVGLFYIFWLVAYACQK